MRHNRLAVMLLSLAATLCLGGTCTQELGQSTADTFLTSLAGSLAEAIAEALIGGAM